MTATPKRKQPSSDTTARKQAEAALRKSEYRLEKAESLGHLGGWEWDIPTGALEWSRQVFDIYGLDPDRDVPSYATVLAMLPAEKREVFIKAIEAALVGTQPFEGDYQVVRRDGTIVDTHTVGEVIRDAAGAPVKMFGMVQDITERKRAEQALLESEARFRMLFDRANDGIFLLSPDGELVAVNDALARMHGYTAGEMLRRNIKDFDTPDTSRQAPERMRSLLAGEARTFEVEHYHRDGHVFPLEVSASQVRLGGKVFIQCLHRDISERKQAEAALAAGRRFVQGVLDATPNLIYIYDLVERRNVFANREIAALLGYSGEQIQAFGADVMAQIIHPEDLDRVLEHHAELAAGHHDARQLEYRVRQASGEWRWLRSHDVPFSRNEDGTVGQIIGAADDITERRRAQEALRESEWRFRGVFEGAPIGIALADPNTGRFLRVNETFCTLLGYSESEMLALDFPSVTHPDDLAANLASSAQLRTGRVQSLSFEKRYLRKDGSTVWAELTLTTLLGTGEPATAHLAMAVDITARKRAEEILRWTADVNGALASLYEPLASDDGEYGDLARAVLTQALRLTESEVGRVSQIRRGAADEGCELLSATVPPEADDARIGDAHEYGGLWEYGLRTGRPVCTNTASTHPAFTSGTGGGGVRDRVLCVPVLFEGAPIGQIAVANSRRQYRDRDVEALGRLAEFFALALRHRQANVAKLEAERRVLHVQKLEGLGVLAGGFAHDFNNLLTVVLGNAQLALDGLESGATVRTHLQRIEAVTHRAANLCRQLLTYAGKSRVVIKPVELSRVVEESAQLVASTMSGKALHYDLADRLPAIDADEDQIRQLLVNLVTNAAEAMDGYEGTVTVSTGVQECDRAFLASCHQGEELVPGPYAYLRVADTGPGMDADTQARLFDPFFTTKFTGRGLGMPVVLGIVRGHRGAIRIASAPRKGTTVSVFFPCEPVQPRAARPDLNETPTVDARYALLIDDEESVLEVVGTMLERLGFRTMAVTDAREAATVYSASRERIALVVLDTTMPHMNGEEVLRTLRRLDPDVPVLVASGYSEHEVASRFASSGPPVTFIQKPFSLQQLAAKVQNVIGTA